MGLTMDLRMGLALKTTPKMAQIIKMELKTVLLTRHATWDGIGMLLMHLVRCAERIAANAIALQIVLTAPAPNSKFKMGYAFPIAKPLLMLHRDLTFGIL